MKKTSNFIIISLIIAILSMAIGYSAFASQLKVNGTAEIVGEWNVKIVSIEAQDVSEGCDIGTPQYTNTSATFNAKLIKPGDSITYLVTIENAGTIDAVLDNIIFKEDENGSSAIKYEASEIDEMLESGEKTTVAIKIEYDLETNEIPSIKTKTITGIIEYVQK